MRPNPWEPYFLYLHSGVTLVYNNYSPAGMLPRTVCGVSGKWLHAPRLGLLAYLLALVTTFLTLAVWAARGAAGGSGSWCSCRAASVPLRRGAIDRGNSVGFLAPIALVSLVALCRRRWRLAATMVVLAAALVSLLAAFRFDAFIFA